jgi:hypothetical protein
VSGIGMVEPLQLLSAREHLSQAEAKYRSEEGLFHLEEGLALLEEVIAGDSPEYRTVAQNLASTYSTRIYDCVKKLVETDRGLPEPDLEHLFRVVLAFDQRSLDLPADARLTKINLVRHLIDRYYEGHSPAEKRAALEQLAKISGEPPADS